MGWIRRLDPALLVDIQATVARVARYGVDEALLTAEIARVEALRQRAEVQNSPVLRGDPRRFFGQYPLPDRELIPRWYRAE